MKPNKNYPHAGENREFLEAIIEGSTVFDFDGLVIRLLREDAELIANALVQFYENNENEYRTLDLILNEYLEGEY